MRQLLIAIEAAETRNTVLVGDDTDLLVLLLHHLLPLENKIYFAPEPKKNATGRVWDIKQIQSDLGSFTCKHLLFLHASFGNILDLWYWKRIYIEKVQGQRKPAASSYHFQ